MFQRNQRCISRRANSQMLRRITVELFPIRQNACSKLEAIAALWRRYVGEAGFL